jgi:signal transduction histidine kinase
MNYWPTFFANWLARLEGGNADPARAGVIAQNLIEMSADEFGKSSEDFEFKIWRADGTVLTQSRTVSWSPRITPEALTSGGTLADSGWHVAAAWTADHAIAVAVGINYHGMRIARDMFLQDAWQTLVLIVTFLGGSWIAVRLTLRPLRRFAGSIADRAPGDLTALATSGYRELRPIVDSFNTLLSKFRSLLQTERAFVANAAHELRTPIAAISAQAHVLISEPDDSGRHTAAAALQLGVKRSARVIRRLLLLSKLDTAPEQFHSESGDVAATIREIAHAQLERAHGRGQQLCLQLRELPRLYFRDALEAAVECLIDNAIRYTPPGTRIDVVCHAEGYETVIAVGDDGPGIPAELRSRVFNRFDRLGRSDEEGSGLGLSIVCHVSQLHGGSVQLRSPENGTGSIFEMRLPLPKVDND